MRGRYSFHSASPSTLFSIGQVGIVTSQPQSTQSPQLALLSGCASGEGAIITRERLGDGGGIVRLGTPQPFGGEPYFLVVTNTDLDAQDPDGRRTKTIAMIAALGEEGVDLDNLWTVLSTPPQFNEQTLHTEAMAPAWLEYRTFLRV